MTRLRRRPMHYLASTLHDGTVLAAYPIRKPSKRAFKEDHLRVDADGVTIEHAGAGGQLSDVQNDTRTRFQDIISVNLNTRRALRAMVLPGLVDLARELQVLHAQLERIEGLLTGAERH